MTRIDTTTPPTARVWFITGCSTGFGRELAEVVLARGDRLIATARHLDQIQDLAQRYPGQAQVVQLDITHPEQVRDAVAAAIAAFGQIDVLVNNAGYGLLGAIEEVEDEEIRRQFETNVFGTLQVTRAVLPHMRQRRRGHILTITSVGGFAGSPGWGIYNGSKFALEGMCEALAQEVAPLGLHVTIIEPGYFRTDFAGRSMTWTKRVLDDYAASSGRTREHMAQVSGQQPGDPARAAQAMLQVVETAHPPLRLVLGADALERVRGKLAQVARELDTWERTTVETAFETGTASSDR